MTDNRKNDMVIGLAVVLLAGLGIFWLIPNEITVSAMGPNDLSPSLVPRISLWICLLLGLSLFLRARFAPRTGAVEQAELDETSEVTRSPRSAIGVAGDLTIWVLSSVALIELLPRVGFIVSAIILLAGWLVFTGVRSVAVIVGVSLILPIILERLSWYALTVQLP